MKQEIRTPPSRFSYLNESFSSCLVLFERSWNSSFNRRQIYFPSFLSETGASLTRRRARRKYEKSKSSVEIKLGQRGRDWPIAKGEARLGRRPDTLVQRWKITAAMTASFYRRPNCFLLLSFRWRWSINTAGIVEWPRLFREKQREIFTWTSFLDATPSPYLLFI